MPQDRAQALLHVIQLDGMPELLVKRVEHASLGTIEQVVMSIEKLVHNLSAVDLLADNGLAQLPIGLAPGVLDPAEISPETGRERVDLTDTLRSLGALQHDEVAPLDGRQFALQLGELVPQVDGAAPGVWIEARFEAFDLSLHHR
jgi:hypothetical protein